MPGIAVASAIVLLLLLVWYVRRKQAVAQTPIGGVAPSGSPVTNTPIPSSGVPATVAVTNTLPAATPTGQAAVTPSTPLTTTIKIVKDTTGIPDSPTDSGSRYLHIGEVTAYDASGAVLNSTDYSDASLSASWDSTNPKLYDAWSAVDGQPATFAHTGIATNPIHTLTLTLKKPMAISKVAVLNRQDCCQPRLDGAVVLLLDSNGAIISRNVLTGAKDVQVFNM